MIMKSYMLSECVLVCVNIFGFVFSFLSWPAGPRGNLSSNGLISGCRSGSYIVEIEKKS